MKRYILFAGYEYENSGGMRDVLATSDDLEKLLVYSERLFIPIPRDVEWWHIFDCNEGDVVAARSYDEEKQYEELSEVRSEMEVKVIK